MLSVTYAECFLLALYAECMLSVFLLFVVILGVVAPFKDSNCTQQLIPKTYTVKLYRP